MRTGAFLEARLATRPAENAASVGEQPVLDTWVEGGNGTSRPFEAEARLIHPTPGEPAQKGTDPGEALTVTGETHIGPWIQSSSLQPGIVMLSRGFRLADLSPRGDCL